MEQINVKLEIIKLLYRNTKDIDTLIEETKQLVKYINEDELNLKKSSPKKNIV